MPREDVPPPAPHPILSRRVVHRKRQDMIDRLLSQPKTETEDYLTHSATHTRFED